MTIYFLKTTEVNGSSDTKFPLRSSAILNIQILIKIVSFGHFNHIFILRQNLKNGHPTRVSNYRQHFIELNLQRFDFSNGFKCSDVYKLEKLNNLIIILFK